jgi:hypothetical protein
MLPKILIFAAACFTAGANGQAAFDGSLRAIILAAGSIVVASLRDIS